MDFLLLDGIIVVFKVACGLLHRHAAVIVQESDFEKALTYLQKSLIEPEQLAPENVPGLLQEVAVTEALLEKYATEFELMKKEIPAYTNQDDAVKECTTLLEKLMDAESSKKNALAQLEVATQQLNAAKSALQSMETELMLSKAEAADLRDQLEEAGAGGDGDGDHGDDDIVLEQDDWVVAEESEL